MHIEQLNDLRRAMNGLIGQPLVGMKRVYGMLCLYFGGTPEHDEYALHLQCFYRLADDERVWLSHNDWYCPAAHLPDDLPEDFDRYAIGSTRLDDRLAELCAHLQGFAVQSLAINALGDLCIRFANGVRLDALADTSGDEELWRFFPVDTGPHYVVSGEDLEVVE